MERNIRSVVEPSFPWQSLASVDALRSTQGRSPCDVMGAFRLPVRQPGQGVGLRIELPPSVAIPKQG